MLEFSSFVSEVFILEFSSFLWCNLLALGAVINMYCNSSSCVLFDVSFVLIPWISRLLMLIFGGIFLVFALNISYVRFRVCCVI